MCMIKSSSLWYELQDFLALDKDDSVSLYWVIKKLILLFFFLVIKIKFHVSFLIFIPSGMKI
jgi:hypothetical protein